MKSYFNSFNAPVRLNVNVLRRLVLRQAALAIGVWQSHPCASAVGQSFQSILDRRCCMMFANIKRCFDRKQSVVAVSAVADGANALFFGFFRAFITSPFCRTFLLQLCNCEIDVFSLGRFKLRSNSAMSATVRLLRCESIYDHTW